MGFKDILSKGFDLVKKETKRHSTSVQENMERCQRYDNDKLMEIYRTGSLDAKIAAGTLLKQRMNGEQPMEDGSWEEDTEWLEDDLWADDEE